MSKQKNLKVIAMILLTTTLLILAASAANVPNVKAATTTDIGCLHYIRRSINWIS